MIIFVLCQIRDREGPPPDACCRFKGRSLETWLGIDGIILNNNWALRPGDVVIRRKSSKILVQFPSVTNAIYHANMEPCREIMVSEIDSDAMSLSDA